MLLCYGGSVQAQLTFSGGIEHFHWEEATTPVVQENGILFAFSLGYTQRKEEGLVWAYRGRFWTGSVDYDGSTLFTNQPISGTTGYVGLMNEGQIRWRKQIMDGDYHANMLFGLGIDDWRRELSARQYEDYKVLYARAGWEMDSEFPNSWLLALGVKYPLKVYEDAHLTNIGFDSNPELNPRGRPSLYGEIGYRLDWQWRITGYLEGYRFNRSNEVHVNEIANGFGPMTVYQPGSDMVIIGIKLQWFLE